MEGISWNTRSLNAEKLSRIVDYAIKYHIDIVNLQEIAPPKQSNGENEGIWKELQTHPRLLKHFDVFVEHGLRKRGIATFIRKSKKILCPGEELAGKDKELSLIHI